MEPMGNFWELFIIVCVWNVVGLVRVPQTPDPTLTVKYLNFPLVMISLQSSVKGYYLEG